MHSRKSKEIWWASEEQLGQMGSRREMEMKGIVPGTDEEMISLIYIPRKSGLLFDDFSLLEEQSVRGLSTSFTLASLV